MELASCVCVSLCSFIIENITSHLFNYFPFEEHLSYFQIIAIVNNRCYEYYVVCFQWVYVFISLGKCTEVQFLSYMVFFLIFPLNIAYIVERDGHLSGSLIRVGLVRYGGSWISGINVSVFIFSSCVCRGSRAWSHSSLSNYISTWRWGMVI